MLDTATPSTSGRGLVAGASAFQSDDVSSILTVPSKICGHGIWVVPRLAGLEKRVRVTLPAPNLVVPQEGSRAAVT